jgi:hypothetical protein
LFTGKVKVQAFVALRLIADSEALTYQDTSNFNMSKNLETGTARAINISVCWQLALIK